MTNMTLAIPEELHKLMRKHSQIKWSEVARRAISQEAQKLETMNKILSKSKFTEKDIEMLGNEIKKGIAKKHGIK